MKFGGRNNLLLKLDNNYINLNFLKTNKNKDSPISNNVPYLLKTIVNFEKIKKIKNNLKHSYSPISYINKKIKIIKKIKKSFSYNNKK